jgi:hypothetical protein
VRGRALASGGWALPRPSKDRVFSTGEQRIYANILLTIGVVMPD